MKTKTPNAVVEGPSGLQMIEATARAIEARMKTAPSGDEFAYRRVAKSASAFTCDPGSRTDVSTITTEAVDRDNEVVLAQGIDLTDYNGAVMFAHDYKQPPVGRNLWIKGKGNGLVAKTQYAAKPKDWGSDGWLPDALLSLMQGDPATCTGKSIGFIPLGYRSATAQELDARPELKGVGIIDKCSLMEYSVCGIPANPESEMLLVSKGVPMDIRDIFRSAAKGTNMEMDDAEPISMSTCIARCKDCISACDKFIANPTGNSSLLGIVRGCRDVCKSCLSTMEGGSNSECAACAVSCHACADACKTAAPQCAKACSACGDACEKMAAQPMKITVPAIIKSFVSAATVKSYAERKAMEQLVGLSDQVAAKMMDRIYELLGRA